MRLDTQPVLALRDLGVGLGGVTVLDGIHLEVEAREFVAILGPNGSGKTTLVRAALGLTPLNRGIVRLFGEDLGSFSEWWRIGYVPQRMTATTGVPATVGEVVISGRVARSRGIARWRSSDRDAARAALDAVGLGRLERASVAALSGGQQQRVLIARALAVEPQLLVLDEPVSSVDLEMQQTLAQTLGWLEANGTTIVLVAHALGAMTPLVTRAVVMEGGHIVYDGAPRSGDTALEHVHPHGPGPPSHWPRAVERT